MARSTELCNLAISHLGVAKEIGDIETEQSQEATACRRFYSKALQVIFRDFAWAFATEIQALALIAEDPNDHWRFSYAYPADCARFEKIQSATPWDTRTSRVNYRVANNGSQRVIYSDQVNAVGEFTKLTEDDSLYPADFEMAFSYMLAGFVAPRLTKGDPFKIKQDMLAMYREWLSIAKANGLNEEQYPPEPDNDLLRGRE